MSTPEAYCFYQEFTPEPTKSFQVDRHYLLYAAKGAMRLEAAGRCWSLAPARAALIAAGQPIQISIPQKMTLCSVLFDPQFCPKPKSPLAVFEMTPLARELVLSCREWGVDGGALTDYSRSIFDTLARVSWKLSQTPSPAAMPSAKSNLMRRAILLTEKRLAQQPRFEELANDLAVTPRSLSRHFADEMGMTWRQTLRQMRMIRAIEALAGTEQSISHIALGVGYGSLSAFNAAFRKFTGHSPKCYRASFRP